MEFLSLWNIRSKTIATSTDDVSLYSTNELHRNESKILNELPVVLLVYPKIQTLDTLEWSMLMRLRIQLELLKNAFTAFVCWSLHYQLLCDC